MGIKKLKPNTPGTRFRSNFTFDEITKDKPEKWAVEFIADRTEGKALERIDQTLKNEPIRVFDFDD